MNTAQVAYALEHDPKTSKKFCGVFPIDKLPQTIDRYPCGLIVNTDPSTKPGMHWVAVFLTSPQNGEWFDSYGKPPEFYGAVFTEFMKTSIVTSGSGTTANRKAIGPTYVDTIVYST